jgi:hypothetical protein
MVQIQVRQVPPRGRVIRRDEGLHGARMLQGHGASPRRETLAESGWAGTGGGGGL